MGFGAGKLCMVYDNLCEMEFEGLKDTISHLTDGRPGTAG